MKRSWVIQCGFLMWVLVMGLFSATTLYQNQTESLPHRYFLSYHATSYDKGDLVVFEHPVFKKTCVKRLMGKEGDQIVVLHHKVYVNQKEIGPLYPHQKNGGKLTPLASQIIPKGYIFVATEHPQSFDSRYAEVGLVPVDKIQGKAIGFWKRSKGD